MKMMLVAVVFITTTIQAIAPFILPRSQSEDSSRELAGWAHLVNLYDQECVYGAWALTPEYTRSIKPHDITQCLFGTDLVQGNRIKISGSEVGDREPTDLLADYFGLPTDFQSTLSFDPRIENILLDINFYIGLDEWLDGLYFRIHAPICYTAWSLGFCEKIIDSGVNGYRPGYFNQTAHGVPRGDLLESFTDYARGESPNLGNLVVYDSLEFAKISTKRKSLTRLSDIQAAFGWNFLQGDDHHFGLNIRMAAPTGNRPKGIFLFEPLVGNGHHWELGLGLTAHYLLWVNPCSRTSIGLYIDANATHLFGSHQRRTFDLVGKPLSRYMLAQRLGSPVTNLFANPIQGTASSSKAPTSQFQNLFIPVANLTTLDVNVSLGAQVDFTAMLNFAHQNYNVDIGYNYWNRTCEKIRFMNACSLPFNGCPNKGLYALKGDAQVYGFVAQDALPPLPNNLKPGSPIALSATENNADIHAGTNTPIGTAFNPTQIQNPTIDNAQYAMFDTAENSHQIVVAPGNSGGDTTQQRTSYEPIFIVTNDIDLDGAETKGVSNKLFGHVSYIWNSCESWNPYLGIGGFYELGHVNEKDCRDQTEDGSCQSCTISQWGVWLKGGVTF